MDHREKSALRQNHKKLVDEIPMGSDILDSLYSAKIFTNNMMEDIESQPTDAAKISRMLKLLPKRGPEAFPKFLDILKVVSPWLADVLRDTLAEKMAESGNENPGNNGSYPTCTVRGQSSDTVPKTLDQADSSTVTVDNNGLLLHSSYRDNGGDGNNDTGNDVEANDEEEEMVTAKSISPTMETDFHEVPSSEEVDTTDSTSIAANQVSESKADCCFTKPQQDLQTKYQILESSYRALTEERDRLQDRCNNLEEMLKKSHFKNEKLQNYYTSLEVQLQNQIEHLQSKITVLQEQLKDSEDGKVQVTEKLTTQVQLLDRMTLDNYNFSCDIKALQRQKAVAEQIKRQLEKDLESCNEEIQSLRKDNDEKDQKIAELQNKLSLLEIKESKKRYHRVAHNSPRRSTTTLTGRPVFGAAPGTQSKWSKINSRFK